MQSHHEQKRRMDILRELMERFEAPDLTLVEAKALRSRLNGLLEQEGPREVETKDSGSQTRRSSSVGVEEWEVGAHPVVFSLCGVG